MRLAHLALPNITSYKHASTLQEHLVSSLLRYKAFPAQFSTPPDPTIITAQFSPVYTCGRREVGSVSAKQQDYLRAGGEADFVEAMRGGQTTFHGPGQLVAYPVIDLKRHGISPRDYIRLLEKTVIKTCGAYGIKAFTTENPGVWTTQERKIAAVGVHLRRNVTSHGIGLNVNTDLWWFSRIVACGLEGKQTTTFEREGVHGNNVEEVGRSFVKNFASGVGIEDVYEITEHELS
ncbi:MAG: hypothetical protein M1812_005549 [Candelaria pacifica]|nr:MAG: hypothetical protein M1812_005549 [Candelaria pacifica]